MNKLTCFKSYDIRGKIGEELNSDIAYRIGQAYALYLQPKNIVIGGDVRLSSNELKIALANGLIDAGVNVIDLGLTGTEEIYFATTFLNTDGGIQITASHNPANYNGMKLVRENSKPISGDSGLFEIQNLAEKNIRTLSKTRGSYQKKSILDNYVEHLLTYISLKNITPIKIVTNSGNGAAGHVINKINQKFTELKVPVEFITINHQPDGSFPNGIPNPLLPECRFETSNAVKEYGADIGVAWDGDFDRCFFFDENGDFIEGYYIVGLLAEAFLKKNTGEKIIYDPRLTWNTIDIVNRNGGHPIISKTGHAFIKERMREENALYGGEMSAHHYFRDFFYCDSGMIPWLLVIELISLREKKLSQLVSKQIEKYPSSGEINLKIINAKESMIFIESYYADHALNISYIDGLSMEFKDWRFNLRESNTESLIRLNVESKHNYSLMNKKKNEILLILEKYQ
ncbi:phosphomannomutase CpsG [Providencia rettgeri]|nr:phosphomannomutase CpsG [Providencia rettgeri]MDK3009191.1 phosphomannomutase CpsG [Providencia rettgeri]